MSKDELAVITPKTVEEADKLSVRLAQSAIALPKDLRGKPADVLAIIMRGAELGMPPMTALASFDIVEGKVGLKAEAQAALVRRNRDVCEYLQVKETTALKCVCVTKRKGDPTETTFEFTMEDAGQAKLTGKTNWQMYPKAMLRARALSGICKMVYSDLVLGLYDPDELGADSAAALPETKPPPAPAGPVVDAEVRLARATPPPPPPRPQHAPTPAKPAPQPVQQELAPDSERAKKLALIDAFMALPTSKAMAEFRIKNGGSNWPEDVLVEWSMRHQELVKQERGGAK